VIRQGIDAGRRQPERRVTVHEAVKRAPEVRTHRTAASQYAAMAVPRAIDASIAGKAAAW
jgi:hypothetical protein